MRDMNSNRSNRSLSVVRAEVAAVSLVVLLHTASIRRANAEDHVDFKYMMYQEDNNRIRVSTPAVLAELDLSPTLSLKIQGVYNAISGASPTGAPPIKKVPSATVAAPTYATQPYSSYVKQAKKNEDDGAAHESAEENEHENGILFRNTTLSLSPMAAGLYHGVTGATQVSTPKPVQTPKPATTSPTKTVTTASPAAAPVAQGKTIIGDIPIANIEDERQAVNLDLTKKLDDHAVTAGLAYSQESDYQSMALALHDAITFNQKNSTISPGVAFTHDRVDVYTRGTTEDKNTIDLFLGFSQVINPTTLFNVNFTLSRVNGYLDDQYKIVQLNNVLIPEHRPDTKDKHIVYLSLLHMFKAIDGTAEIGYRYYDDTFGVRGDTFSIDWYQKLGSMFTLRPSFRYYQQTAADFYGTTFSGSPKYYSADYRVSALQAVSYGLMLIFKPGDSWSLDVGAERYEQSGRDSITDSRVYPSATIFTAGARFWF